jgi:AcrR family transcriptional regulator
VNNDSSYLFTEPDPVPLRRGPKAPGESSRNAHRMKILSAVIHETAERGYAETSVGDISRRAKISRRTFYEHFDGKEAAFLAAFDVAVGILQAQVEAELGNAAVWTDRLRAGMSAFVDILTRNPALTRVFTIEVPRVGAEGSEHQRLFHEWWAGVLRAEVATARSHDAALAQVSCDLSVDLSAAVVRGMDGLVRSWLEHGDSVRLLRDCFVLLLSVLTADIHVLVDKMENGASPGELTAYLEQSRPRVP